jgi:hypothetical protein
MIPRTNLPALWLMLISAELLIGLPARGSGTEIYTEEAPPAPRMERMPQPHAGLVWAPGHWEWSGKAFYWIDGDWLVERRKRHWVAAQWQQAGSKWHFLPGHWGNQV